MSTRIALCDASGPLTDLLQKLSGEDGEQWLNDLNKFNRKENPWPVAHATVVVAARELYSEEKLAKEILGNDYLAIGEIEKATNQPFTDEQMEILRAQLSKLDKKTIKALQKDGFALMSGPVSPRSLIEVRESGRELFYTKSNAWYEKHVFASNDKAHFGLIALRKDVIPKSTSKTWDEQLALLRKDHPSDEVPNAGEFAWCTTLFAKVRGIRLFQGVYARTKSVDSDGSRVYAGRFDSGGVYVSYYWDGYRDDLLGLTSVRKFG